MHNCKFYLSKCPIGCTPGHDCVCEDNERMRARIAELAAERDAVKERFVQLGHDLHMAKTGARVHMSAFDEERARCLELGAELREARAEIARLRAHRGES